MSTLRFVLSATLVCLAAPLALGQTYYVTSASGTGAVPFGRIDALGNTSPIGSGLNFGSDNSPMPQLLAAPNGTLYAFDTGCGNGSLQSWGTVNPATGAFTRIGNLGSVFDVGTGTPALGFDSSGDLIAAGDSTTGSFIFGTLNVTTGAFTSTANASTYGTVLNDLAQFSGFDGLGHIVTVVPEPSSLALAIVCAFGLVVYWYWGRRRRPNSP